VASDATRQQHQRRQAHELGGSAGCGTRQVAGWAWSFCYGVKVAWILGVWPAASRQCDVIGGSCLKADPEADTH
jgi:hypothetical protein